MLVQVETRPALDELEAIAQVDGVDGVFIGPADCHASLGYAGETANPAVLPKIEDADPPHPQGRQGARHPHAGREADAKRYLELGGACSVAVGADIGLLARGSGSAARQSSS